MEVVKQRENIQCYTETDILARMEVMAKRGIDLITIHSSVRLNDLNELNISNRLIPSTSRGGTMILKNMKNLYFIID